MCDFKTNFTFSTLIEDDKDNAMTFHGCETPEDVIGCLNVAEEATETNYSEQDRDAIEACLNTSGRNHLHLHGNKKGVYHLLAFNDTEFHVYLNGVGVAEKTKKEIFRSISNARMIVLPLTLTTQQKMMGEMLRNPSNKGKFINLL